MEIKNIYLYWCFKFATWYNTKYGSNDDYIWVEHRVKKDVENGNDRTTEQLGST